MTNQEMGSQKPGEEIFPAGQEQQGGITEQQRETIEKTAGLEADAVIRPLEREKRYPEKNLIDKLNNVFWFLGVVTRANKTEPENSMPERPLSVRRERAELYKQVKQAKKQKDREEMKFFFGEAHERDEILKQFLTQGEVQVSSPDAGNNEARFTIVSPSAEKEDREKPPIAFIPGISNDLACVDSIAQELAFSGRKVVVVSYPESFMGKVSPEFVEKSQKALGYEAHAEFFRSAIEKILPNQEIELWGYSTGGPIIAEILKRNPDLAKKVTDAVMVCPAGSVKQSRLQLFTGLAKEVRSMVSKGLASFVLTVGRKISEGVEPETKEQRKMKKKVFGSLLGKIQKPSIVPEDIKIKEGGSISVISYGKDDVTKSRKLDNSRNASIKTAVLEGSHVTPIMSPKKLIEQVVALQNK